MQGEYTLGIIKIFQVLKPEYSYNLADDEMAPCIAWWQT